MPQHLSTGSALSAQRDFPRITAWDSTLAWLADPYRFIGRTCAELGADVFEARLLLRPTLCMSGARAAEAFCDLVRVQREGAAPEPLRATLFGKGGVQGLDGLHHRQRKAFFMAVVSPERVDRLVECVRQEWEQALTGWSARGPMPLYRALQPVLMRAACTWAGVPLPESDVRARTRQCVAMFDSAVAGPVGHLRSRYARRQAETWLERLVEEARAGRLKLPPGGAAHAAAWHRDEVSAEPLPPRTAAVELLNVLRPTVAVSVFITHLARALHLHPAWKAVLADQPADSADALAFVQEVRRQCPFFPAVMAKVRKEFVWNGFRFPEGRRLVLDLYGTNHDPRIWTEPDAFRPERWRGLRPSRFEFIPQGGGEASTNHRCPGEDVAVQLMLLALRMLLCRMTYDVPPQDLDLAMDRLPAVPRQGLLIHRVGLSASHSR